MHVVTLKHTVALALWGCFATGMTPCLAQDRDSWQQPERVLDAIGVTAGMTVGDVGAGNGYFTLRIARRVGAHGKVYANDIRAERLQLIEDQCRTQGITNVQTLVGDVDDPRLPDGVLDIAFMSFVFHMLEKPVALLENLKPALKHDGTLVIVEFKAEEIRTGPYPENERVVELAAEAGFRLLRTENFIDRADIFVFSLDH